MKIVMGVHHFPPRYNAGAELRTFRTARWMRKNGNEVKVICIEEIGQGPESGVAWKDDVYMEVPVRRMSFDISKASDPLRWEYDNPWIEDHLKDYLSETKPDIFHLVSGYLMGAGSLKAARSLRIPYIVTATDYWFLCPRLNLLRSDGELSDPFEFDPQNCVRCKYEESRRYRYLSRLAPKIMGWFWALAFTSLWGRDSRYAQMAKNFTQRNAILMELLNSAEAVICPSAFLVQIFSARGIQSDKLVLSTHGLDISNWLPFQKVKKSPGTFRIGYLGQIDAHKGVHLAIEAFLKLTSDVPLEFEVYGNLDHSPGYSSALQRIARRDPRIKMMGKYKNETVGQILSQLDVVVIPSLWNEIGPWVMFEAFETKTPVIASNIPNMSYGIRHGENGLLFERGNSADLAHQLQRIISDSDLYQRLVAGIQPVKKIDQEMAELQQVYQSVA